MKKFPAWWGPYQAVETVFFWTRYQNEDGFPTYPDWVFDAGEWYSNTWLGHIHSYLAEAYMSWKNKNRVKIHIDRWDAWNADNTIAHVALPLLKQLKKDKHGAPWVYPADVPKKLRPTKAQVDKYNQNGEVDPLFFKRWEWVLDEIIWAFEQHVDDDAEDQFHTGETDIVWTKVDVYGKEIGADYNDEIYYRMDKGPNHTSKFDKEGYDAWHERKQNGFALFGKYYTALWD